MYEEPQINATYRCTIFVNGIVHDKTFYKYVGRTPSGRWHIFLDNDLDYAGKNHLCKVTSFPVHECVFDRNINIKHIYTLIKPI